MAERSVPFVDLQAQYATIKDEIHDALEVVLDSSAYVLGPSVEAFEKAFAEYVGTTHCVAVNSGTSALHAALLAAGVGPGDEVVSVSHTFIATTWSISYVGAKPVFVDVDPETYTMDASALEGAITKKTKAILPVHLYGQPADMDAICEVAAAHGIPVIEDCAQAHGAEYKGRRVGTIGVMGCFSFYPGKNLGAYGEGGAVTTDDDGLAEALRMIRNHGQRERYKHERLGFNYRMTGFQGAVLGVKLPHLEAWTEARRAHAKLYDELLADAKVVAPVEAEGRRHVYHLYVIQADDREGLSAALKDAGVASGFHYPIPVHLQKAYEHLGCKPGDLPVTERVAARCLSLPMYPELADDDIRYTADAVRKFTG